MPRTNIIPVNFSLPDWMRGMDEILGTKVPDPLIRWSQRNAKKPTTACQHCGVHYTTLGLTRHEGKCFYNPAVKKARGKRK